MFWEKNLKIDFKLLHKDARVPTRGKSGDAAYDLYSVEYCVLNPFERRAIKTGIAVSIPDGYFGRILPRSGLSLKNGMDTMAGVVDSSYTGEIAVVLINLNFSFVHGQIDVNKDFLSALTGNPYKFEIRPGDKIAQMAILPCANVDWVQVEELKRTERGADGFGSTGR